MDPKNQRMDPPRDLKKCTTQVSASLGRSLQTQNERIFQQNAVLQEGTGRDLKKPVEQRQV